MKTETFLCADEARFNPEFETRSQDTVAAATRARRMRRGDVLARLVADGARDARAYVERWIAGRGAE